MVQKRIPVFLIAVIVCAGLLFFPQKNGAEDLEQKKNELSEIKKKIDEERKKIEEAKNEEKSVLRELSDMDFEIRHKEKELLALTYEIDIVNDEITSHREKIEELEAKIEEMRSLIEKRLASLYKLRKAGYVPVLFSAESYTEMKKRGKYLSLIIEADRELFFSYQTTMNALADTLSELEKKKDELSLLKEGVSRKKKEIQKEKVKKEGYLTRVKDKRSTYEEVLDDLEKAKKELSALIEKLIREREEAAKKKSLDHPHTSPSAGGAFVALKGKLPYPVEGTIITRYGTGKDPKYENPIFNKGIEIKASEGTHFRAVADGEVIFAEYFYGYGNLIIIDHGDSYYTVYAHAKEIQTGVGDTVKGGEIIGTVGDTGSLKGPCLYFEIRHHGQTTDPQLWFAKK
jgi:septal ring factor EnvC (AmiA/AmiB activator)